MKNQPLLLASAVAGALSFAAAGCILGSDANMNSMLYGAQGGASGTAGAAGGTGNGAGGANIDTTLIGVGVATFDTNIQSFAFSTYDEMPNLAVHNGGMAPTLDWDGTQGSPSSPAGSLKVFAPYSGANQYVDIQSPTFPSSMLRDWSGGKLHVRVMVDSGSTFAGQIEPYVDTTSAFTFVGSSINVMMSGGWHDYVVPLDTAMTRNAGYDNKQVILYGVHIGSGGGGASQKPVTFHIDSFSIEGVAAPPTSDAGADTGTAADTGTSSDAAVGN
jgi:hypothetical protein